MQKTTECAQGQDNESTDSFQNYSSRRLLMFMYKAGTCTKKRNFFFNIMCGEFRFDGDFYVGNLDASTELCQYWSLSRRNFFLFLAEWYSFFLSFLVQNFFLIFFFFTRDFLSLLIFPWARASTCEFCKVHAVKKIWKLHERRAPS